MINLILRITKFCLIPIIMLFFSSCKMEIEPGNFLTTIKGSGNVITETRNIQDSFDKIHVSSLIKVELEQSPNYEVIVKADDNLIPYVITDVEGSTLRIRLDKVSISNMKDIKVYVKMPYVTGLKATSSSEIDVKGGLTSESISLISGSTAEIKLGDVNAKYVSVEASSSSDIKIGRIFAVEFKATTTSTADFDAYVEADKIKINASSSSDVELKGKALDLVAQTSSTATIDAKDLLVNNITATASSSSTIKVHPIVSLTARASSTADIYYYKQPKVVDKKASSSGSVEFKK